jgi:glycerol-3-phosphate acyltransferase PlsX
LKTINIAIDAMGGDHGLSVVIPASIRAVRNNPNLNLLLVGAEDKISAALKKYGVLNREQFSIINATEIVNMDEMPSLALRNKKDSSMRVAINLVKEGRAEACVSAGNTGALMAIARFVLKTLPSLVKPG